MNAPKMFATAAGIIALSFALTGCNADGAGDSPSAASDGTILPPGGSPGPVPTAVEPPAGESPAPVPSAVEPPAGEAPAPAPTAVEPPAGIPPAPTPSATRAPRTGPVPPQQAVRPRTVRPAPTAVAGGCPVGAAQLAEALRRSPEGAGSVGVKGVDCFRGYATALSVAKGPVDAAGVLFRYDAGARSWAVEDFGSSMSCTGVPAVVVAQLDRCRG